MVVAHIYANPVNTDKGLFRPPPALIMRFYVASIKCIALPTYYRALTLWGASLYSWGMDAQNNESEELELKQLEARVEELIRTCTVLKDENHSLRQHQDNLVSERSKLIEKTETARIRVEAMINRLKGMESGHE